MLLVFGSPLQKISLIILNGSVPLNMRVVTLVTVKQYLHLTVKILLYYGFLLVFRLCRFVEVISVTFSQFILIFLITISIYFILFDIANFKYFEDIVLD